MIVRKNIRKILPSNPGQRIKIEYVLDNGKFKEVGRVDMDELIQSGYAEASLYSLLDRFKTVDAVVAAKGGSQPPLYGDFTTLPQSVYEARSAVDNALDELIKNNERSQVSEEKETSSNGETHVED